MCKSLRLIQLVSKCLFFVVQRLVSATLDIIALLLPLNVHIVQQAIAVVAKL